jgi:hypothetical protein
MTMIAIYWYKEICNLLLGIVYGSYLLSTVYKSIYVTLCMWLCHIMLHTTCTYTVPVVYYILCAR